MRNTDLFLEEKRVLLFFWYSWYIMGAGLLLLIPFVNVILLEYIVRDESGVKRSEIFKKLHWK